MLCETLGVGGANNSGVGVTVKMLSEKLPVGHWALLNGDPCCRTSITTAVSCELTNSSSFLRARQLSVSCELTKSSSFLRARQLSGVGDGSEEGDVDDRDVDSVEALAILQLSSSSGRRCARCSM